MNDGVSPPTSHSPAQTSSERGSLVEQAMERYLEQLESGRHPDRAAFLAQYPEIADALEGQLETLEFLHSAAPDITSSETNPSGARGSAVAGRTSLGDFQLLRTIGRGGMGIVYEARQLSLDRRVAVKVLPFAAMLDTQQLKRFQNEARAAAALDHPNIVPIYFVGQERGVHFYAMQLIEGQSLAQIIADLRGEAHQQPGTASSIDAELSARQQDSLDTATSDSPISTLRSDSRRRFFGNVARLGSQAAEALEHAHQLGVIHRDIKPGNLLLDSTGRLWVADFGLARREQNESITGHADIVGTIGYMSPEQLAGARVADPRSDVYSLGATLFELLTLQRHQASDDNEPIPLRRIDPKTPADLETIIAKAMAADPLERYESAQHFADDLRSFASGHPIQAVPPTASVRAMKWVRRRPRMTAAVASTVVLACVLLAVSTVLVWRSQARTASALKESRSHAERVENLLYLADMQLAYQAWDRGRVAQVPAILNRQMPRAGEPDRRGLEWHLLNAMSEQPSRKVIGRHDGSANQLALFPDGRRVVSVGDDMTWRVWDVETGANLLTIERSTLGERQLYSVAVSPDGSTVATGSQAVQLWNAETGERKDQLTRFGSNVQSIAFSNDGSKIAAASRYKRVRVFSTGGELLAEIGDESRHESLEFTPDSQGLVVPSRGPDPQDPTRIGGFIRLWQSDLSQVEREFFSVAERHQDLTIAACSANGRFIAMGHRYGGYPIRIVDRHTGVDLVSLPDVSDEPNALAVSPDGSVVAVGYNNGSVEYWKVGQRDSGKLLPPERTYSVPAHKGKVWSIRFVDDRRFVTCGADGLVLEWRIPGTENPEFHGEDWTSFLDVSPDGRYVARCGKSFLLSRIPSNQVVTTLGPEVTACSFSRCSELLVMALGDQRQVDVYDLERGSIAATAKFDARVENVACSPTDDQLAVIDGKGNLSFRSLPTMAQLGEASVDGPLDGSQYTFCYTPDGTSVLAAGDFGRIMVVDAKTHQVSPFSAVVSRTKFLALDQQGTTLASAHDDGVIRVWDWPSGRLRDSLMGHEKGVASLAFTADGRLLVSTSGDGTIRLWSVVHGREFGVLHRNTGSGWSLALAPDMNRLFFGCERRPSGQPSMGVFTLGEASIR